MSGFASVTDSPKPFTRWPATFIVASCPPWPEIEGRPAQGGVIRPGADPRSRPQWPEAFWLLTYKTRHSYTLEAPSDFPLETRVNALATAVRAILET